MSPDWNRIFPDADHRWIMALRQEDSADYFADRDSTGAVRAERAHWLAEDPKKYAALLPEAYPALQETLELARTLGAKFDSDGNAFEQLLALGRIWEPDFVWMHAGQDGIHRAIGGVVCFPSSWAFGEKLGQPMRDIHHLVPGLNDALGRQIDTFLTKQVPGVPWRRENWSLSRIADLNQHVSRPRPRLDETITPDEVWVRLEHQLLMKLPRSGSILFGIRIEVVPIKRIIDNPEAAKRFARILASMSAEAVGYKNFAAARPALIAMLQ